MDGNEKKKIYYIIYYYIYNIYIIYIINFVLGYKGGLL